VLTLRTGTSSIDSRDISSKLTQARGNRDPIRGLFLRCTITANILVMHRTTPLSLALASQLERIKYWDLGVGQGEFNHPFMYSSTVLVLEYHWDKCWSAIMCAFLGEDGGTWIFVGCVIQGKVPSGNVVSLEGWLLRLDDIAFWVNVEVCVF